MNWRQRLVNAQLLVNRAVYEMNRGGFTINNPEYKKDPDMKYILVQVFDAVNELNELIKEYETHE